MAILCLDFAVPCTNLALSLWCINAPRGNRVTGFAQSRSRRKQERRRAAARLDGRRFEKG